MESFTSKLNSGLLAKRLARLVGGDVLCDGVARQLYSTDGSIYKLVPSVVVCPRDVDDVVKLVQFCQETGIPLAARGAGTGLAGESLTSGILLDFSRYMTRILEFDADSGKVLAEPGVILDEINRVARADGWQFGPDPSSGSRATVGGSVANNATGAHSLHYGYCSDNLAALETVFADGRVVFGEDKEIQSSIYSLLNPHRKLIDQNWPKLKRNRAGYNLKGAIGRAGGDILKLLAGSEGTLGIFTKLQLQLVRIPSVKILLSANFNKLNLSARAVSIILEFDPASIELMDGALIKLAQMQPAADASLMIEFAADNLDDAFSRMRKCRDRLEKEFSGDVELVEIIAPEDQKRNWAARKNAVPLLFKLPGPKKPIPFVEDIAVDASKLPEYLDGMQTIFRNYGLVASFYGHAGAGEFHIRPFLDLRDVEDRKKISSLAKDAYELVWSLGGTISGEHAVGLVRSWALRKQYGPAYELMEQVKRIFDPNGILNPGKIIVTDTDLPLENIRADEVFSGDRNSNLIYREQKISEIADVCNGCGQCKAFDPSQIMCPVFRVNRDEFSSPRAKANLLRTYLAGLLSSKDLLSASAQKVLDACLLCGNCERECPSAAQIPKMIMELRSLRHGNITEQFFVNSEFSEWMMGKFARLGNWIFSKAGIRRFLEMAVGIDKRAVMPEFASYSLRKLVKKYQPEKVRYRAAWFVDVFARYHDFRLAEDIVRVCSANDIELVIPDQRGSNMPALAYGYLDQARKAARFNIEQLSQYDLILCFEPTGTLCLTKEYKCLVDDCELDVRDGMDFLWQMHVKGELKIPALAENLKLGYHTPCHLRQLQIGEPGYKLLSLIEGLKVEKLADNCCGLAGTFGLNKKNYETSQAIAKNLSDSIFKGNYDMLASECSSCRMQLKHISRLPALHPVQLFSKGYFK